MAEIEAQDQPFAAERLLLGGEPRYNRQQVAARAGVDAERAASLWRSLGFATPADTDVVFTEADVAALRNVTALHDAGLGGAAAELALTRATGQAMARLAESQVGVLRDKVTEQGLVPEGGFAALAPLVPEIELLLRYVWRRHLLAATERLAAEAAQPSETAPLAVGFADITGYTNLSRGLDEDRLAEFLEDFEASASTVVTEHGGRVVKTVGDEIMFVADSPEAAADIGLALAARVSVLDGRRDLHVGVAYGPVLRRLGDVYGTVVNLASRLTALARPGTVLIDRALADAITDQPRYRVRRLRRVSVRGFAHLTPWLLQPAGAARTAWRRL